MTPPCAQGRRRIAFVSYFNPVASQSGGAEYVRAIAGALREIADALHLIVLDPAAWGPPAGRAPVSYLSAFDSVWAPFSLYAGGRLTSLRPQRWLRYGAMRAGLWRDRAAIAEGRADAASLRAAGRRIARLNCNAVVAWRPFAAPVFEHVGADVLRVYLVDDVYRLRADSFAAADRPTPFPASLIDREAAACRAAEVCLAIQQDEAAHVRAVAPGARVFTAPHPVAMPATRPAARPEPTALFVGSALTQANVDGLGWFLDAVWPQVIAARPAATLRVCGTVASTLAPDLPGVRAVGFTPDLAVEYARAAASIAPLRIGSGLKIKVVESLAAGLPVVATTVGAQGLSDASEAAISIADAPEAFAAALIARLDAAADPAPREAAFVLARKRFDRAVVADTLREALR